MRKVIGIGETVLDIIFKNGQPIGAYPGGSSFNAIISLGRSGVNSTFISEAGRDRVGRHIIDFLKENGVNADNVNVFPDSKSPISLAFLDEHNDAEYISTRIIPTTSSISSTLTCSPTILCSSDRSTPSTRSFGRRWSDCSTMHAVTAPLSIMT